jgi:hypothetical protein
MGEERAETQEIPMKEEIGKETYMDTQIPKESKPSDTQRKRRGEKESGSKKKAKARRKPLETSLTTDDVELIDTIVKDRLSEVWENEKKHMDLILDQIQEVKTVLKQLRIRAEKSSKDKPTKTKEGVLVGETMKITMRGSTNFIVTPEMLFIDEETKQNPMKNMDTLDLVLTKISTNALYKLQISVVQEIQSRERI